MFLRLRKFDDELRQALSADAREADLRVTKLLAGFIAQVVDPVLFDFVLVHGEQKMRPALQVEAERQLLFRHEGRP